MPDPSPSWLSREATVAPVGFSRWLVPPAAIAVHICIGQVYAFSVFNKPLAADLGVPIGRVQMAYSIALVMLGLSAAVFGKWVERSGPRKSMLASWLCFCGGLALTALAATLKLPWLLLGGYGLLGGIGLGLGYIAPVSTLVKWFPDRPGMATGMAIMGFGGGALVGSPLAQELLRRFAGPSDSGAAPALLVMAALYSCFMIFGAWIVRVPAADWRPAAAPARAGSPQAPVPVGVPVDQAWRTRQFWLLWIVLCMNVSAGIGILGLASDMLQDMFGVSAVVGAGFTGLLSIFNMGGRFFWSSISDFTGRRAVYCIYFILGIALYALLPWTQQTGRQSIFLACTAIIISMYGAGFATIPAYLRDLFGTLQVGAIHGRLITAWSMAAVIGPGLINGLFSHRVAAGVPRAEAYNGTFHLMCILLGIGLVANLLVRPLSAEQPTRSRDS